MKLYFDNAAAVPVRPVTMSRLAALAQDYSANQEASGAAAESVRAALSTAEHRLLNAVCGSKAQGAPCCGRTPAPTPSAPPSRRFC